MKILITGAHSTGKTTLIEEFVKKNQGTTNIHVIPEVARQMIEAGYPLGKQGNTDSYTHYLSKQLELEISSNSIDYDYLIADRSLIDGVTHPIVNNSIYYSLLDV